MHYALVFLEGIVTFISPCLLPMLPVYVSYFIGGPEGGQRRAICNALGFVLGFSAVFVSMGAFAGSLGRLLIQYRTPLDVAAGVIVVLLGLNYLGVFRISFLNRSAVREAAPRKTGFVPSVLLGIAFSVGWTPCVGTFLGSALLMASQQGSSLEGVLMLLAYSLGLGIPFILSAALLERLKGAFSFIRRHFTAINRIAGALLVLVGLMMAGGLLRRLLPLTPLP